MKIHNILIYFFIISLCSCGNLFTPMINENKQVDYYEDTDSQKILGFGNIEAGNNVLIVLGMDIYKFRIENIGSGDIGNKIINYLVNPDLYYYYPTDPNSTVFYKKFISNWFNWKDKVLDCDNAYYYVIITNTEEDIIPSIKYADLVFDYFILYFHGDRTYVESRAITRGDLIYNFSDSDIKKCFSSDCLSLVLSCNSNGLGISNYSFAIMLSYLTGVKNMVASNSKVFDNLDIGRCYYGDFKKVSYIDYDLQAVYNQYKSLSYEQSYNSYRKKHIVFQLPISSILNNKAEECLEKELYYLVYSSYDDYYKYTDITNSYCDVYLNYQTKDIILKYSTKYGDYITSSVCCKISSDYFNVISFVADVYNPNTMDGKYLEFVFK